MRKTIELKPTAYRWLLRHRFMTEDVIMSVIQDLPLTNRENINANHFKLSFNRKKNKKFVKVIMWIHETSTKYIVYKMHCTKI